MEAISLTNKQRKNLNNGDLWLKTAFGFANSIHSLGDGWMDALLSQSTLYMFVPK